MRTAKKPADSGDKKMSRASIKKKELDYRNSRFDIVFKLAKNYCTPATAQGPSSITKEGILLFTFRKNKGNHVEKLLY